MKQYWPGLPGFSSATPQPTVTETANTQQVLDIEVRTLKKTVNEQQAAIAKLNSQLSELKEQHKDSDVLVLALREQLKEKDAKIAELTQSGEEKNKSYTEIRNLVTEKVRKISSLEAQRDNYVGQLKTARESEVALNKSLVEMHNAMESKENSFKKLENDLQKKIGQLTSDYLTLQEDRQLLMSDIHSLREENTQLKSTNEDLSFQQSELKDILESCRLEILKTSDAKESAKEYTAKARAEEQKKSDSDFCARFSLPETEFVIKCYYCVYRFISHGWLYITPSYVCFESISLVMAGTKISFPILSIKNIKKVRMFYYLPGTDNGLEFTLNSSMKHAFGSFVQREKVLSNIRNQASKCGHEISIFDFAGVPQITSGQNEDPNDSVKGGTPKGKERISN